ncbi:homeobox protein prospero isoform X1 [Folsomia candida]|uniref:homeobox protein prospero isoform X1 n=1 Tax=Folsomia candida TaxID=158441 RepID=UPI000B9058E1|nr:homeobox protein prospero isoform X1 [Folsomia candida]XP_035714019.1 homeobox protein prospero isoform X1 [Folsomia candida]XP_035714021.1 homeobox protein prospero isoform X1 [Folsomia candida]
MAPSNDHLSSQIKLTLQHFIKAKMIFFWTQLPSTRKIQQYFPDVEDPSDIEQIEKFFRASRIFFYAKIRQVARALFAQKPHAHYNAITIREDYKFYKLLSYYFDPLRSIKPPEEFRCTVIQSIQDYFVALQTGVEDESEFMRRVGQAMMQIEKDPPEWLQSRDFMEFVHPEGDPPSR